MATRVVIGGRRFSRTGESGMILVLLCLLCAADASAHPPYEHPVRTISGPDGRSLHLVKSYVDGIFFTDPVKLVVRDADDRTVAETDYGRDVSVVCWRSRPCVVFRYDGPAPVFPVNIWRLEGTALRETHSAGLVALGVLAPLWDHASGYVISCVSLGVPLLMFWLVSQAQGSRRRALLQSVVAVLAVPYLGIWFYTVALLSYLSLPLVILVCSVCGGAVVLARKGALRAGVTEAALRKLVRYAALGIAALAGAAIIGLIALVVRLASYSNGITFEEPAVRAPLAKARITRVKGVTNEVFATLAPGVKVADVVNLDPFDGFDPQMTREEAEGRLGPPTGRWTDPVYRVQASYYDRPGGRISLVRQGASTWSTVGHPVSCTHDYVLRDARLRAQLLAWLPPQDTVQVNVLRDVGWGGVTVFLNRTCCTYLVLTARDGDPDPRIDAGSHP
jgi:hypothetical protein